MSAQGMTDVQVRGFARGVELGSLRHLGLSLIVGAGALTYVSIVGSGVKPEGFFVLVSLALVAYNLVRIRQARRAAAGTIEVARTFVVGQRRSHVVRGWTFLVVAPVLVAVVWTDAVQSAMPASAWLVCASRAIAITRFAPS